MLFIVGLLGIVGSFVLLVLALLLSTGSSCTAYKDDEERLAGYEFRDWAAKWRRRTVRLLLLFLVVGFTSLIFSLVYGYYYNFGLVKDHYRDTPIVSVKSETRTEGSFTLFFGSLSGVEYYLVFVDMGNSRYERDKVRVTGTTIVETNSISPRLRLVDELSLKDSSWWLLPFDFSKREGRNYEIIVPEGTILKEFRLE